MSDNTEVNQKVTELKMRERELSTIVNSMTIQIERMATINENLQKDIEDLSKNNDKIKTLQIDIANLKSGMKVIMWVSAAFMTSGIGLTMNFIFTQGG